MQEQSAFPHPDHDHESCVATGLDAARRVFQAQRARLTPDRAQVLEILLRQHTAVGAYDIIQRMDWEDRRPASSVVYRALDRLRALGLVHRLHSRNAFIACPSPEDMHGAQFLICTHCNVIAEIDDPRIERDVVAAARGAGFRVERPMIEIEGLCPHCADGAAG